MRGRLPPSLEDRIRYNAAVFDSRFFEESWPIISRGLESEVDAESEVGWILGHVAPPAGGRILDAPCGFGRHSLALARRGFDVTGVDLSETELQRAKERAAEVGLPLQLVRQDMRDMEFSGEFDLALNLFSSIGRGDVGVVAFQRRPPPSRPLLHRAQAGRGLRSRHA